MKTPAARKSQIVNRKSEPAESLAFANELAMQSDGWAQLAPYGDFPGQAVIRTADGAVQEFSAIQRLDRQSAEAMTLKFHSPWNRVKRYLKGCWIYNGHPDMPNAGGKYPDREPKGLIADLECRADGLYCLPVFTNEGAALLGGSRQLFFSGRWTSDELPQENGRRIFRPAELKSAGLTPHPNLPVHHANDLPPSPPSGERAGVRGRADDKNQPQNQQNQMNKKLILDLLTAHGVSFANDATDEQLAAEIQKLGDRARLADTLAREKATLANEHGGLADQLTASVALVASVSSERDQAGANFANERKARIADLLDSALTAGRITAAERPQWEQRLGVPANFANELAALGRLHQVVKTVSQLNQAGERKMEIANAGQRGDAVRTLVNLEMQRAGCDYDTAYRAVAKTNPALFAAMQQPKTN